MIDLSPDLTGKKILVIAKHDTIGQAIQLNLEVILHLEVRRFTLNSLTSQDAHSEISGFQPDLILIAEPTDTGNITEIYHSITWLWYNKNIPVLLLCDQPENHALDTKYTYCLQFPYEQQELHAKLLAIFCQNGLHQTTKNINPRPPQPSILIVEDDWIVATDLKVILEQHGYSVCNIASTAEDAVTAAVKNTPDLILLGIRLQSTLVGFETASRIQLRIKVPIVYISTFKDLSILTKTGNILTYEYILKPFDDREVHMAVEIALHKHQLELELLQKERFLKTVLQHVSDGVIATDSDGHIVQMNASAAKLTGYEIDDALAHDLREIYEPHSGILNKSLEDSNTGVKHYLESKLTNRNGDTIPIDETVVAIMNDCVIPNDERTPVQIITFRDISPRVYSQNLIQQHTEELEQHKMELDAFTWAVAHEIRDPVNITREFAGLLIHNQPPLINEEMYRGLDMINQLTVRVRNTVDNLLLLTSLRDTTVTFEPINMVEIVERAEKRLEALKRRFDAEIVQMGHWPNALGKSEWVEELWVNFLSNAIRLGGSPPKLVIGATDQGDEIDYWIRDNGPSLTEEEKRHLFSPLPSYQNTHRYNQSLRMTVVSRIASRLGSRLSVESNSDQGNTFTFTLPTKGQNHASL